MKKALIVGLAVVFFSVSAYAISPTKITGEYGNHCAMNMVKGQQVMTDCSVNWTDTTTHKTYCFGNEAAKQEWATNIKHFITAADASYTGLMAKNQAMHSANEAMNHAHDAMKAAQGETMHK